MLHAGTTVEMTDGKEKLQQIRSNLENGSVPKATVRELLSWFNAQRRGTNVVNKIRSQLQEIGLKTIPDFEVPHLDVELEFELTTPDGRERTDYSDPVPRIGQLDAASNFPKTIDRDAKVSEAITIMLMNDFSQLPVMQGRRNPDGYISWETIGVRSYTDGQPEYVRECVEEVSVLDEEEALFDALPIIAEKQFVLVRGSDESITGLVTVSDITMEFNRLAEHFLQIGIIENHVRYIIQNEFKTSELSQVKDPSDDDREINSVADLTFGEYIRLIEKPDYWSRLDLDLSRKHFCNRLRKVRGIRNDVMHFHPDALPDEDRRLLKRTVSFIRHLK